MNEKTKKILASGLVVLAAGMGVGGTFLFADVNPEPVTVTELVEIEVPVEVIKEVNVTNTVTEYVDVEVEVDNGDMEWVLTRLEDKEIIADAEEIVEELKAEDFALNLVFDYMESNEFLEDLDDENLVEEDEADVYRIYKDFDDVKVIKSDFDDEEYKFNVKFKVEDLDEDEKYTKHAVFNVIDGEVEFVKLI